jgi:hypothetical protein
MIKNYDEQGEYKIKDVQGRLDFAFDLTKYLAKTGDAVTGVPVITVSPPGELVVESTPSHDGNIITVWLVGGVSGRFYKLRCKFDTLLGRVDAKSMRIKAQWN